MERLQLWVQRKKKSLIKSSQELKQVAELEFPLLQLVTVASCVCPFPVHLSKGLGTLFSIAPAHRVLTSRVGSQFSQSLHIHHVLHPPYHLNGLPLGSLQLVHLHCTRGLQTAHVFSCHPEVNNCFCQLVARTRLLIQPQCVVSLGWCQCAFLTPVQFVHQHPYLRSAGHPSWHCCVGLSWHCCETAFVSAEFVRLLSSQSSSLS